MYRSGHETGLDTGKKRQFEWWESGVGATTNLTKHKFPADQSAAIIAEEVKKVRGKEPSSKTRGHDEKNEPLNLLNYRVT